MPLIVQRGADLESETGEGRDVVPTVRQCNSDLLFIFGKGMFPPWTTPRVLLFFSV